MKKKRRQILRNPKSNLSQKARLYGERRIFISISSRLFAQGAGWCSERRFLTNNEWMIAKSSSASHQKGIIKLKSLDHNFNKDN
jgi:hypothetical protein